MTEQEAIEEFNCLKKTRIFIPRNDTINRAIKALEKQIPHLVANDGMRIPFSYYCPNCKEELSDGGYQDEDVKYCPNCGQAIKWE